MSKIYTSTPLFTPHRLLAAIILLSLLLRLGLMLYVMHIGPDRRFVMADTASYLRPAEAMAQLGRFSQDVQHPNEPAFLRTPGYPLFLAVFLELTGDVGWNAVIVQNLLWCAFVPLLVWGLGRMLWSERAGLWGALLVGLDPCSMLFGQFLLTETLFTIFLTGALFAGLKYFQSRHSRWAFCLGLLLAIATLIRPIAQYFVIAGIAAIAATIWRTSPRPSPSQIARAFLCFLIPWMLLVGGWCWRNYKLCGRADLGPVTGINLLYNYAAGVVALGQGSADVKAFRKVRADFQKQYPFYYTDLEEHQRATIIDRVPEYQAVAMSILRKHPWRVVQMQGICMYRFFTDASGEIFRVLLNGDRKREEGTTEQIRTRSLRRVSLAVAAARIHLAIVGVFVALAFWIKWRKRKWSWGDLWLLAALFYFAWASAAPEVNGRFRVPVMPILAAYAGIGMSCLPLKRLKTPQPGSLIKSDILKKPENARP